VPVPVIDEYEIEVVEQVHRFTRRSARDDCRHRIRIGGAGAVRVSPLRAARFSLDVDRSAMRPDRGSPDWHGSKRAGRSDARAGREQREGEGRYGRPPDA
jgi:hypothetical protein